MFDILDEIEILKKLKNGEIIILLPIMFNLGKAIIFSIKKNKFKTIKYETEVAINGKSFHKD